MLVFIFFIIFESRLIFKYSICYSYIQIRGRHLVNSPHRSVISNVMLRLWRHVRVMASLIRTDLIMFI